MRGQKIVDLPRKRTSHRQRDRFVDEHDGDVLPDRIEELLVRTNQAAIDAFLDGLSGAILELARGDFLVEAADKGRLREFDGLMRFRAAHDFEQFRVNHKTGLKFGDGFAHERFLERRVGEAPDLSARFAAS